MSGQLDQISRVIGGLEASVAAITAAMDENRKLANQRHGENSERLDNITDRVGSIEHKLGPLADTVKIMQPIMASYQTTRWKMAGAFGAVLFILGLFGWLIEAALGGLVKWLFGHFH